MNNIEVCLSPALIQTIERAGDKIAVVVDVLRATTAFCAVFDKGAKRIITTSDLVKAEAMKAQGYKVASERGGLKVGFADFGNSPTEFLKMDLRGQEIVYSTTNGTKAIDMATHFKNTLIACFSNLSAVAKTLSKENEDIVIICSGWKDGYSLEDALCAGALTAKLIETGDFITADDASFAQMNLWQHLHGQLKEIVKNGTHYQRLEKLDKSEDLDYCFDIDTSTSVPMWDGEGLVKQK